MLSVAVTMTAGGFADAMHLHNHTHGGVTEPLCVPAYQATPGSTAVVLFDCSTASNMALLLAFPYTCHLFELH